MATQCITARGVVTSGRGNARNHLSDSAREILHLTQTTLFPGSLNVILERPLFLSNTTAMRFAQAQRLLWPGRLNRLPVWFYRWQQTPLHLLEIVSEVRLRDRLNLEDGDPVEIEVEPTHVEEVSRASYLAWLALWAGRSDWPYTHDRYYWRTRPLAIDLGTTQDDGDHRIVRNIAKRLYRRVKEVPVIGPLAAGLRNRLNTQPANDEAMRYVFARENLDFCSTPTERELAQIRNLLNYTKTSGSAYSAQQFPAGYHTLEIFGQRLPGQRDPHLRLRNLPIDFTGKRVLDLGTNQGGMLFAIRDRIEFGVGLDYDKRMVNAANRLAAGVRADNLHFFVFDFDKDPLELIFDLIPGGRVDVVFLLSVCMWIRNWREVIRFCAESADITVFESNGSDEQQTDQEIELRIRFANVRLIKESSDDDPTQKRRRLFLCEEPRTARADASRTDLARLQQ